MDYLSILRQWSNYQINEEHKKRKYLSWALISSFINTSKALILEKYQKGLSIAGNLNEQYKVDGNSWEPFLFDFSQHPFLAGAREERYSDYLKWVLELLIYENNLGHKILSDLLKINDVDILSKCKGNKPRIKREITVEKGHEGQSGRIDLLFLYDDVIIDVEIKTTNAEFADLNKNIGYRDSLEKIYPKPKYSHRHRLLVTDSLRPYYHNDPSVPIEEYYWVLKWKDLCLFLRGICTDHNISNNLLLSNILCFVGLIEQLLLGYKNLANRKYVDDRSFQYLTSLSGHFLPKGDTFND